MNTFEDRLLTELKAVVAEQAEAREAKSRRITGLPAFRPRPDGGRGRPRALAAAGIAASVALAGAVAAAELTGGAARPAASSQYSLVADLLDQAANAAGGPRVPQPGPGQLHLTVSYEIGAFLERRDGHTVSLTSCSVRWYNPQGQPIRSIGEIVPAGGKQQCAGIPLYKPGKRFPPTARHWYPSPASLVDDPAALLAQLDAAAGRGAAYWSLTVGQGQALTRDQIAFSLVERLLQAPITDELRASLYRATIGIHGVTLNPHAVDALGRPGTGVSMRLTEVAGLVYADEFILANGTFGFLGTRDTAKGTIPRQVALVRSAIVNRS